MSAPTSIEQRTFDDATVVEHATAAAEAIRAINHLARGGPMPAPLIYEVLGYLKEAAHRFPKPWTRSPTRWATRCSSTT
ncbi:MAG TPA: hypothetical protein VHV82_21270 [Sporichthyaceae bacterium]|jgi:hypothetical protein|nr:hypothetical protein [Sporichthyaceae bacterium]